MDRSSGDNSETVRRERSSGDNSECEGGVE